MQNKKGVCHTPVIPEESNSYINPFTLLKLET